MLLLDIENFAAYNAAQGEERGDDCLKSVADGLRSVAQRPTDVLGRYAGGQFALLLPNTDAKGASKVAQRAIEAVGALQIPCTEPAGLGRVRLSVAGSCFTLSRATSAAVATSAVAHDLIAAAESALTAARQIGGRQAQISDIGNPDRSVPAAIRS